MSRKFHGFLSVGLLVAAAAIAAVFLFSVSMRAGGAYILLLIASGMAIILGYCAGCPGKKHCAHVITARLAAPFSRKPRPYTPREHLAVAAGFMTIVMFPQPWLILKPPVFAAFWILTVLAAADILICLCPGCGNVFCPVGTLMKSLKQSSYTHHHS